LTELIADKTWITDRGLIQLSVSQTSGLPLCQKLAVLSIQETRTSPEGLSIFFQYHPKVHRIDHPETIHMFKTCSTGPVCSLVKLTSTKETVSNDQWEMALDKCPGVETILVTSPGLKNENLYKMMTLSHLQDLHLSSSCSSNLNFQEGLAPVLAVIGKNLKRLVKILLLTSLIKIRI
jgi:hypothetical protein